MLRLDVLADEPVLDRLPAPTLDVATQRLIDDLWDAERQRRGASLFDGQLFSLLGRDGNILHGCLVPYRRFIAQRRRPDLFPLLRIRPLAVSGLITCPDGIVFGQRNAGTTQDGGRWELAPSGGIDGNTPTPRAALIQELNEELGCPESTIATTRAFALVEDEAVHTIDIGYAIETALSAADIRGYYVQTLSGEYDAIDIVPRNALDQFLATRDVIEVSRLFLAQMSLTVG